MFDPLTLPICARGVATVTTSGVRVRERPETGAILGSLSAGQRVTVWALEANWAIVQAENGLSGWVSGQYLHLDRTLTP